MSDEEEAPEARTEYHDRELGAAKHPFAPDAYRAGWDDASRWWTQVAEDRRQQMLALSSAYTATLAQLSDEITHSRTISRMERTGVVHAIQHVAQGCISYEFEQSLTDAVLRALNINVSEE